MKKWKTPQHAYTFCLIFVSGLIKIFPLMLPAAVPNIWGSFTPLLEVSQWHVSHWCIVEVWDNIAPAKKARCMDKRSSAAGWGQSHSEYLKERCSYVQRYLDGIHNRREVWNKTNCIWVRDRWFPKGTLSTKSHFSRNTIFSAFPSQS